MQSRLRYNSTDERDIVVGYACMCAAGSDICATQVFVEFLHFRLRRISMAQRPDTLFPTVRGPTMALQRAVEKFDAWVCSLLPFGL